MKRTQEDLLTLVLQEISLVSERLKKIEAKFDPPAEHFSVYGRFSVCPACNLTYRTGNNHTCPPVGDMEG